MATYFFHEERRSTGEEGVLELVRYYYDDISAEILTRSFRIVSRTAEKEFLRNDRIPLADLRADLKAQLLQLLGRRAGSERRAA